MLKYMKDPLNDTFIKGVAGHGSTQSTLPPQETGVAV